MLNQSAHNIEGSISHDFLNSFVEILEELPTELTRVCTNVRELDIKTYNIMHEVNNIFPQINLLPVGDPKRSKLSMKLQQLLINMQDNCDEKIRHTSMLNEMIEIKHKLLSDHRSEPLTDISNIKQERERAQSPVIQNSQNVITTQSTSATFVNIPQKASSYDSSGNANSNNMSGNNSDSKNNDRTSKRPRRARADTGIDVDNETNIKIETQVIKQPHIPQNSSNLKRTSSGSTNKKKKKKVGKQTSNQNNQTSTREQVVPDLLPQEEAIDPDEPTYCLCEQISFGEMIMCDNDLCPIEWFHFSCVSLMTKPKGKWYCPNCRGDRPNIMKNKNQFMKELERYNKEKLSN